jgi:hypothetical protein
MRLVFSAVVVASLCAAPVFAQSDHSSKSETIPETPKAGLHLAKGQAKVGGQAGRRNPNLTYHGGPVRAATTEIHPIFWGTTWPGSIGDKADIIKFYQGASGSGYLGSNHEYTQTGGAQVSTTLSVFSIATDYATNSVGGGSTSAILTEVCKVIGSANVKANGYYPVYVDTKRGNAGYCAWHSAGKCTQSGPTVQFAFFFNLDGDPGCDPGGALNGHSQGLTAIANVSGHELSEMLTDPQLNAWYDQQGAENSDKCAWTFGTNSIVFTGNNTAWKIQGNWSNAAYTAGQGYLSGGTEQTGCIDGYSHVQ